MQKEFDLRDAARDAWLWGLPLIEMAQQRNARIQEGTMPNEFQHKRRLMGSGKSFITTPNNDTLYSQAWIDLSGGAVKVTIPVSGSRYFSLALMDMYTNHFSILGMRTTGVQGGTFTLVGPQDATSDRRAIRSPTPWVWAFGRTLVDDEADLPEAHKVQDQLRIDGPPVAIKERTYANRNSPWNEYFASVQELMEENPPPATDDALLGRIAPLLRLGRRFDASRFGDAEIRQIEAGMADGLQMAVSYKKQLQNLNGWSISSVDKGLSQQNYLVRAGVAMTGLGALTRNEDMTFSAKGSDDVGFDSAKRWKLTFSASELPSVDSFWSLSMYRRNAEGQQFFFENPINRFSIGDRTQGLAYGDDGSLTIWMTREDPGGDATRNWLPIPTEGNFVVALRAYLPRPTMLNGQYVPPRIIEF